MKPPVSGREWARGHPIVPRGRDPILRPAQVYFFLLFFDPVWLPWVVWGSIWARNGLKGYTGGLGRPAGGNGKAVAPPAAHFRPPPARVAHGRVVKDSNSTHTVLC